jgi:alpha-D-ribose 1-methylphosphonate 5-triphosphate synthase subunit PhnG
MPTFKCYVRVDSHEGSSTVVTATGPTKRSARSAALHDAQLVFSEGASSIEVIHCIESGSQEVASDSTPNQ